MSANDAITIGRPLPLMESVAPGEKTSICVKWRDGGAQIVDLAPDIFTYKIYRPLRDDPALFGSIHLIEGGAAIAWGQDDAIDMPATTIARLASEQIEPVDFAAFLKRHRLTLDAAAAQLGLSRRQIAYYASERKPPRHVALACAFLDGKLRVGRR